MRTLAADGKPATVTEATVATEIHESFDGQGYVAPEVTLHPITLLDYLTEACQLLVGELVFFATRLNVSSFTNIDGGLATNSVNRCECNPNRLTPWKVNACNACHIRLPLPLLVTGIFADYANHPTPFDYLAFLTDRLD